MRTQSPLQRVSGLPCSLRPIFTRGFLADQAFTKAPARRALTPDSRCSTPTTTRSSSMSSFTRRLAITHSTHGVDISRQLDPQCSSRFAVRRQGGLPPHGRQCRRLDKNSREHACFTHWLDRRVSLPHQACPHPKACFHIHFKVKKGDREPPTTQLNIAGIPAIKSTNASGPDLDREAASATSNRPRPGNRRAGRPLR